MRTLSGKEVEEVTPSATSLAILRALQHMGRGKGMYLGTADKGKVSKRRAKSRVAKKSRRKNRS